MIRHVDGVLGNDESACDESFSLDGLLEYPQYTRPADFRGKTVPEVLLSGHHANIRKWQREQALIKTAQVRPELLETARLDKKGYGFSGGKRFLEGQRRETVMTNADRIFLENCRDILKNGVWNKGEKIRPRWSDGEPAYTVKNSVL